LPLVAFCCGIGWPACIGHRSETKCGPTGLDRFHEPGSWAKQKPPERTSMATHCVHAGPTSRHTRQSRLPDREAARRRRGLDGRRAVVTRIRAALLLQHHCGRCHGLGLAWLGLAWHLQCVGCDKKITWPSVGLSLGLIGTCWYFFGLIRSCWYVVAFGENGHQTDYRGLRLFTPG
jgi:hypothetical protein